MTEIQNDHTVANLVKAGLVLLILMSVTAFTTVSLKTAYSILMGGLVSIGNFLWMRNVLQRIFGLCPANPAKYAQLRFIARLTITGLIVFGLITSGHINIIGLVIGLSLIPITIILFTLYSATRNGG